MTEPSTAIPFESLESAVRNRLADLRDKPLAMYPTGLESVDEMLGGGIAAGEYGIIGARTSHGKTMFLLQWAYNVALQGHPCLVISAEMTKAALADRCMQFCSETAAAEWSTENGNAQAFDDAMAFLTTGRRPILLADSCLHVDKVAAAISQAKTHHGCRFVVVDYLQRLRGCGNSRYEQVSYVSNMLASAAVENNVAVVAAAQLSRMSVTEAKEFVPKLHHLKESGDIEQDADVIAFLAWPWKLDTKNKPGIYRIYGAKGRNRGIHGSGICELSFDPKHQRLSEREFGVTERPNYEPAFADYGGTQCEF